MNKQKTIAIAIFIFFITLYSLFCIGHYGGDGYDDFLTAKSIVLRHTFALKDEPVPEGHYDIDTFHYKKTAGMYGRDGRIYSSRGGLAIPLMLSVLYYAGHLVSFVFKSVPQDFITIFFVSFCNPIASAVNCLLVFLIAVNLLYSYRTAIALAFIYGLATMAPVYARTGFAEPVLTMFLLLSIYFILKYKIGRKKIHFILGAVALGVAVFSKSIAALFVPFIALYAIWVVFYDGKYDKKRVLEFMFFAVPLGIMLLFIFSFNYYIYGGIFKFGDREAITITTRVIKAPHILKGLYYYLLSTGKSFFLFNLPLILAFLGFKKVPQERKKEAVLFLALFLANLIFFTMSFRRGSLFSWGPRYMLPSAAFMVLMIGNFYENNRNLFGKLWIWALSIIGFFIMLPCMFVSQSKFYFFVKEQLGQQEFMINYIPDLSPIRGAWEMFITRVIYMVRGIDVPFFYSPDYGLIPWVKMSMSGYNDFALWFMKVLSFKPEYFPLVAGIVAFLIIIAAASLFYLVRCAFSPRDIKG